MNVKHTPRDYWQLRDEIVARYPKLSRRIQQIAQFALEHPNDMALQNITMIASHIGVPPSAIIRFAKALDYRCFSDMQAVFRLPLSERSPSHHNGHLRLRGETQSQAVKTTAAVPEEFPATGIEPLEQAVDLLAARRAIHIIGTRRSFPEAAYLAYALTYLERHACLLDGMGGMLFEQANGILVDDVLIAVSFPPYALETAEIAARSAAKGAAVIVITDSPLSPIARTATVCLEVRERDVHALPLLPATLSLLQTLIINVSLRFKDRQRSQESAQSGAE